MSSKFGWCLTDDCETCPPRPDITCGCECHQNKEVATVE